MKRTSLALLSLALAGVLAGCNNGPGGKAPNGNASGGATAAPGAGAPASPASPATPASPTPDQNKDKGAK